MWLHGHYSTQVKPRRSERDPGPWFFSSFHGSKVCLQQQTQYIWGCRGNPLQTFWALRDLIPAGDAKKCVNSMRISFWSIRDMGVKGLQKIPFRCCCGAYLHTGRAWQREPSQRNVRFLNFNPQKKHEIQTPFFLYLVVTSNICNIQGLLQRLGMVICRSVWRNELGGSMVQILLVPGDIGVKLSCTSLWVKLSSMYAARFHMWMYLWSCLLITLMDFLYKFCLGQFFFPKIWQKLWWTVVTNIYFLEPVLKG